MKKFMLPAGLLAMLAGPALTGTALADENTIYLGGYGGSFEKLLKEKILPPFEQETGAKIVYVPGNSTDTLAKLQAQKGNQELDVVFLDDGPMYQAISFGFCDTIADAEIFDGTAGRRPRPGTISPMPSTRASWWSRRSAIPMGCTRWSWPPG
jgi:putative spermidine/putrescine transport system substrate-binding protein